MAKHKLHKGRIKLWLRYEAKINFFLLIKRLGWNFKSMGLIISSETEQYREAKVKTKSLQQCNADFVSEMLAAVTAK